MVAGQLHTPAVQGTLYNSICTCVYVHVHVTCMYIITCMYTVAIHKHVHVHVDVHVHCTSVGTCIARCMCNKSW